MTDRIARLNAELAERDRRIAELEAELEDRCRQWFNVLQAVAIPLGCLASTDPQKNEHVIKAAGQMERKR